MSRIAVLEDNPDLLDDVVYNLRQAGHDVVGTTSAAALDAHLAGAEIDILILDLGLPDEDGLSVARRLRAARPALGIIIMTARTRLPDRVAGLRDGADIYLSKPVDLEELEAVVAAMIRRLPPPPTCWRIDTRAMRLTTPAGVALPLTSPEVQLLRALSAAPEQKASRQVLIAALGGDYLAFDERRLENIISRLRAKIHAVAPESPSLKALRGSGYIFTEPLRAD